MYLMTRRALSTGHVTGCQLPQETRIHHTFDDVASTVHQSLVSGGGVERSQGGVQGGGQEGSGVSNGRYNDGCASAGVSDGVSSSSYGDGGGV